jgi:trypsin
MRTRARPRTLTGANDFPRDRQLSYRDESTARLLLRARPMRFAFAAVVVFALAACGGTPPQTDDGPDSYQLPPPSTPTEQPLPPPPPKTLAPPVEIDEATFAEVVYVMMRDHRGGLWFCTGTLVSKNTVVTAAHCLDPKEFMFYYIVAPLAPGEPRVTAASPKMFGGSYEDVANPDMGFLTLEEPVELSRYAVMTDVVSQVEAGQKVTAAAVVRTAEEPEAPLAMSKQQPVSSTVEFGYEYGFGTPMFTHGGDSGAGLFLVENGKTTHKLIGVARQPDPDRNLDHFSRIGAPFLQWYAAQNK